MRPLAALAEVDGAAARDHFWDILGNDVADESFNVGGLLDAFPELVAIAGPAEALPVAREACEYLHVLLSPVAVIDRLAEVVDVAGADVSAACACVLVDGSLASDVIRSDASARGATDAIRLGCDPLMDQLRASVEADPDTTRRVLHIVAAARLASVSAASDAPAALEDIANASEEESDRELADVLLEEDRGNDVDITQLEEAGVALLGLMHRPVKRPDEIGGSASEDVREPEWLEAVAPAAGDAPTHSNGSLIIGEFTRLTRLSWETPTMVREQAVVRAETEERGATPFLMDVPLLHYHEIVGATSIAEELGDAITFHFTEPNDYPWSSLGAALSPSFALSLGWRPSSGLLAWEDEEGNQTCWSVWWRADISTDNHRVSTTSSAKAGLFLPRRRRPLPSPVSLALSTGSSPLRTQ